MSLPLDGDLLSCRQRLSELAVTHVWSGYDTELFLEFGQLKSSRLTRNPVGQASLMFEGEWQLAVSDRVMAGSGDGDGGAEVVSSILLGKSVADLVFIDGTFDLSVVFSGSGCLSSIKSNAVESDWTIFIRQSDDSSVVLSIENGLLTSTHGGSLLRRD